MLAGLVARRDGIAALDGLDQTHLLLDRDRREFGCLDVLDGDRAKLSAIWPSIIMMKLSACSLSATLAMAWMS